MCGEDALRGCVGKRLVPPDSLEDRADRPWHKFIVTNAMLFALGRFAAGNCQNLLEDFFADRVQGSPRQDPSCIDVHVVT